MSNEKDIQVLQSLLQYYRSKCSQLEYEFVLYKSNVEAEIKKFSQQPQEEKKPDGKID
jgi:hypothetical protein